MTDEQPSDAMPESESSVPPSPGAETAGIETAGIETAGIETAGIETAGTETAGTETAGERQAGKPSRAERLEARAARLRESEAARARARAQSSAAGQTAPVRASSALVIVVSIVALLALAAAGTSLALYVGERGTASSARHASTSAQHQLDSDAALRAGAISAATTFAKDFGSYDYQHLSQNFATIQSHLTTSFKTSFASISSKLQSVIVQYKATSVASVEGVGIESLKGDTAVLLVFLNQKITNSTSTTPTVDSNRLVMTLVRSGHTWLMSDLRLV